MRQQDNGLWMKAPNRLKGGLELQTLPYPGFPTDLQSAFLAALSIANGKSFITETVFENRFKIVGNLKKMGADISVNGRTAEIKGVKALKGTEVEASDLRGGAALVIAALAAEGETQVKNICHIDRGYDKFELALSALGAKIERKNYDDRK